MGGFDSPGRLPNILSEVIMKDDIYKAALRAISSYSLGILQATADNPPTPNEAKKLWKALKMIHDKAQETVFPPKPPYKAPKAKPFIKRTTLIK